jgi:hypothetical protein
MNTLITIKSALGIHQAEALSALLKSNGISNVINSIPSGVDNTQFEDSFIYAVDIDINDYETAKNVLFHNTDIDFCAINTKYPLLSFSNAELLEITQNRKKWGDYNYKLAISLIKIRALNNPSTENLSESQLNKIGNNKVYHRKSWLFQLIIAFAFITLLGIFIYFIS